MSWSVQKGIKSLPWNNMNRILEAWVIICIISVIILLFHNKKVSLKQNFTMDKGQTSPTTGPYLLSREGGHNPTAAWDLGPQAVQNTVQTPTKDPRYTLVEVPLREDQTGPLQAQVELLTPYNCPYYRS